MNLTVARNVTCGGFAVWGPAGESAGEFLCLLEPNLRPVDNVVCGGGLVQSVQFGTDLALEFRFIEPDGLVPLAGDSPDNARNPSRLHRVRLVTVLGPMTREEKEGDLSMEVCRHLVV
jgi:hypothetical protein